MTFIVKDVTISQEFIANYEKMYNKLLIKDPWTDNVFKKNGLYKMYIIDVIIDMLDFPVEINGILNEQYTIMHNLIEEVLFKTSSIAFLNLMKFIEQYTKRSLELVSWKNSLNQPVELDIRLLNSIDECLSWLKLHLKV